MSGQADPKLLVFRLGELVCAVEAQAVREVSPIRPVTRLPGAPPAVSGLVSVRGSLLPVVDGRCLLVQPGTARGAMLVLDWEPQGAGLLVDEVLDLVSLRTTEWAEAASLPGVEARVVRGVGRSEELAFVWLDYQALLAPLFGT